MATNATSKMPHFFSHFFQLPQQVLHLCDVDQSEHSWQMLTWRSKRGMMPLVSQGGTEENILGFSKHKTPIFYTPLHTPRLFTFLSPEVSCKCFLSGEVTPVIKDRKQRLDGEQHEVCHVSRPWLFDYNHFIWHGHYSWQTTSILSETYCGSMQSCSRQRFLYDLYQPSVKVYRSNKFKMFYLLVYLTGTMQKNKKNR